jgi:hypothetical protein
VSGSNCFQDLQRKLLQVLEEAGVFACWFVVGRKEILFNIGGQSMAFVHTIVISALMSPECHGLVRVYQKAPTSPTHRSLVRGHTNAILARPELDLVVGVWKPTLPRCSPPVCIGAVSYRILEESGTRYRTGKIYHSHQRIASIQFRSCGDGGFGQGWVTHRNARQTGPSEGEIR